MSSIVTAALKKNNESPISMRNKYMVKGWMREGTVYNLEARKLNHGKVNCPLP